MGEAKRRKSLDRNYGIKPYTIEFLDYESWKLSFNEKFQELLEEFEETEIKEDLYNKCMWFGKIIIENNSYNFEVKMMIGEDKGLPEFDVEFSEIENRKHERIIDYNQERISTEILEIIMPKVIDLYSDSEE